MREPPELTRGLERRFALPMAMSEVLDPSDEIWTIHEWVPVVLESLDPIVAYAFRLVRRIPLVPEAQVVFLRGGDGQFVPYGEIEVSPRDISRSVGANVEGQPRSVVSAAQPGSSLRVLAI